MKRKAPAPTKTQGAGEQQSHLAEASIVPRTSAVTVMTEKGFSTLQAAFALRGHAFHRQDGGGFLAMRWGLVRELADAHEARRFLEQIGGSL